MSAIKGIILDVDGVIVGDKVDVNSPWPSQPVVEALKKVREHGVFISLCTAKPHYAVSKIIQDSHLNNYHITDAGGVVINPFTHSVLKKTTIPQDIGIEVLDVCLENGVYTEVYTVDGYFVQHDLVSEITEKHTYILQKEPNVVSSIRQVLFDNEVTKIMPVAKNPEEKMMLDKKLEPYKEMASITWGVHPIALPLQFGIITAKHISKKQATKDLMKEWNLSADQMLAIGDSLSDWLFMELCDHVATVENGDVVLKETIQKKDYFIGTSVNEDGLLEILIHFGLL